MFKRRIISVCFTHFVALMMVAQFVVTGGHVHFAHSHQDVTQVWPVPLAKDGERAPYKAPDKLPSDHDPFCMLCWVHAVDGNGLLPIAAQVLRPAIVTPSQPPALSDQIAAFVAPSSFDPRGPPVALLIPDAMLSS